MIWNMLYHFNCFPTFIINTLASSQRWLHIGGLPNDFSQHSSLIHWLHIVGVANTQTTTFTWILQMAQIVYPYISVFIRYKLDYRERLYLRIDLWTLDKPNYPLYNSNYPCFYSFIYAGGYYCRIFVRQQSSNNTICNIKIKSQTAGYCVQCSPRIRWTTS